MVVNLMKTNDIRELTTAEIETKVKALKEELFQSSLPTCYRTIRESNSHP